MINNNLTELTTGFYGLSINYGFYLDKVPTNVTQELDIQVKELQQDFSKGVPWNKYLSSEVEHEYKFTPGILTQNYLKDLTAKLDSELSHIPKNETIVCKDLWVNYISKTEYSSVHYHNGIYSFVIWHEMPYNIENERNRVIHKTPQHIPKSGCFEFMFPSMENMQMKINTFTIPTDKKMEGYIAMFPSSLGHMVYPFYTSDDYRISIAGNIRKQNDFVPNN